MSYHLLEITTMAIVYRVEMKISDPRTGATSIGPYQFNRYKLANMNDFESCDWITCESHQPEPEDDNIANYAGMHFGFKDLQQFFNWFVDDINRLSWCGFHIVVYSVPDNLIKYGDSQLCFSMSKATVQAYHDIQELIHPIYDDLSDGFIQHLETKRYTA